MDQPQEFSDAQLRNIAADPSITAADLRKLTPGERARFGAIYQQVKMGRKDATTSSETPGIWQRGLKIANAGLEQIGTGIAKGAGDTAETFGRVVSNPVTTALGNIGGALVAQARHGKEAVTPPVSASRAFDEFHRGNIAEGPLQKGGKFVEQAAEYLIPGAAGTTGTVSRGLESLLVRAGLAAPGKLGQPLIFGARKAAQTVAEAGSAGAIAHLHGEASPGREAAMGAAIPTATRLAAAAAPTAARIFPYAAGAGAGHLAAGAVGGLAGVLGVMAIVRQGLKLTPAERDVLVAGVRKYGPQVLRLGVGGYEQSQTKPGEVERRLHELLP